MKQTILVAGATGNLGGRIVQALLKSGAQVRVLTRQQIEGAKKQQLIDLGVEVFAVDMTNLQELKPRVLTLYIFK